MAGYGARGGKQGLDPNSILYNIYLLDKLNESKQQKQTSIESGYNKLQVGEEKEAERITKQTVGSATGGKGDVKDFPETASAINDYSVRTRVPVTQRRIFGPSKTTVHEMLPSQEMEQRFQSRGEIAKGEAEKVTSRSKMELEALNAGKSGVGRRFEAGEFMTPETITKEVGEEAKTRDLVLKSDLTRAQTEHAQAGTRELTAKSKIEEAKGQYAGMIAESEASIKQSEAFLKGEEAKRQPAIAEEHRQRIIKGNLEIEHLRTQMAKDKVISDNLAAAMDPKTGPNERSRAIRDIAVAQGHGAEILKMDEASQLHYVQEIERSAKLDKEAYTALHNKRIDEASNYMEKANSIRTSAALTIRNSLIAQGRTAEAANITVELTGIANTEGFLGTKPVTGSIKVDVDTAVAYQTGQLQDAIRSGKAITVNGKGVSPAEALVLLARIERPHAANDIKVISQAVEGANVAPEIKDQARQLINSRMPKMEGRAHSEAPTGRDLEVRKPQPNPLMPTTKPEEKQERDPLLNPDLRRNLEKAGGRVGKLEKKSQELFGKEYGLLSGIEQARVLKEVPE